MEQNKTLDFEALMSLNEEERTAAIAQYNASIEASAKEAYAKEHSSELKAARYESAKYKMALDKSLPDFGERIDAIEEIIASSEAFSSMSDEEKLRTAYYIDRGKNGGEPTAEELVTKLKSNPEAMRIIEAAVIEKLSVKGAPALLAGRGNASLPLTPKEKPKTLNEASKMAREAFGIQ